MSVKNVADAEDVMFVMYIFKRENMVLPQRGKVRISKETIKIVRKALDGNDIQAAVLQLQQIPRFPINKKQVNYYNN